MPPLMNHRIELSKAAARIAKRSVCYGDLCWPGLMLDVEHNGAYDHDGSESFYSDRARVDALIAEGYEVLELTGKLVADLEAFEEVALHIAKLQGKRIRKEARGATDARMALRNELYAWNARGGRPKRWFTRA